MTESREELKEGKGGRKEEGRGRGKSICRMEKCIWWPWRGDGTHSFVCLNSYCVCGGVIAPSLFLNSERRKEFLVKWHMVLIYFIGWLFFNSTLWRWTVFDLIWFSVLHMTEKQSHIYNKLKDVRRAVFMFICICFKPDWTSEIRRCGMAKCGSEVKCVNVTE